MCGKPENIGEGAGMTERQCAGLEIAEHWGIDAYMQIGELAGGALRLRGSNPLPGAKIYRSDNQINYFEKKLSALVQHSTDNYRQMKGRAKLTCLYVAN